MNILFFLTPKAEVDFVYNDERIADVLEKLDIHGYNAIPVISRKGKYLGSISAVDIVNHMRKHSNLAIDFISEIKVSEITRKKDNSPVYANAKMEALVTKALIESYVPVIDDKKIFIGIIKRRDIFEFCYKKYKSIEEK